jgi:phosphopantetheinyl transferase
MKGGVPRAFASLGTEIGTWWVAPQLRRVLAACTGEDPAQLRFTYNERGKPYLAEPCSRIHFNLAHTQGLAVLAVGLVPDIGVDVEATTSMTDLDDLAERCFSPAELRTYHTLPQPARTEAFYLAWTRKEAFIKATGEGLARPLGSFDVELVPDADPRFLRVPAGHDVEAWVLVHLEPAAGYVGAPRRSVTRESPSGSGPSTRADPASPGRTVDATQHPFTATDRQHPAGGGLIVQAA